MGWRLNQRLTLHRWQLARSRQPRGPFWGKAACTSHFVKQVECPEAKTQKINTYGRARTCPLQCMHTHVVCFQRWQLQLSPRACDVDPPQHCFVLGQIPQGFALAAGLEVALLRSAAPILAVLDYERLVVVFNVWNWQDFQLLEVVAWKWWEECFRGVSGLLNNGSFLHDHQLTVTRASARGKLLVPCSLNGFPCLHNHNKIDLSCRQHYDILSALFAHFHAIKKLYFSGSLPQTQQWHWTSIEM